MRIQDVPKLRGRILAITLASLSVCSPAIAQQTLGAITGTVKDVSGAVIPDATVKARNVSTNLEIIEHTQSNGSYTVQNIPIGTYELSFTKSGFQKEVHTQVLVNSDRTTTVDSTLQVGAVSSTVEVTSTPLMNQVDTTTGYVVDQRRTWQSGNFRQRPARYKQQFFPQRHQHQQSL